MSDLPQGWTRRSVESICKRVTSGGTPSRRNPAFYENGTINWFKTGELKDRALYESEEKITPQALEVSSAKVFHCPGDHRTGAQAEPDFKKLTILNISYSYVPNLNWQDTPDSPVIMDRIYSTKSGSRWPAGGNHGTRGGLVGFNDGHTSWQSMLPYDLKDKTGKQVVLSP